MTITKQPMLERKRNLKPGEIIPLKFDEAFKIMYANPKYMEILTLLISRILKVNYAEIEGKVELAPTSIPNETLGEIKSDRDIVVSVRTSPEYKIVMEINIREDFYQNVINRNLYYAFQMSGGGLEEGKNYKDMKIIYQVNFNDFFVDRENKPAIDLYNLTNETGNILTDRFKVLHINIEECYKLWYNKSYKGMFGPFEEDLVLLAAAMDANTEEEFNKCLEEVRTRPEIIELMEKVIVDMTKDEEMWGRWYNKEEEEAKIWAGIKYEVMENVAKGKVDSGIEKEIFDELKAQIEKDGHDRGYAEGHAKGCAEGRDRGIAEGHAEGIAEGHAEGIAEGRAEGIAEGRAEGIAEGRAEGIAEGRAELIQKMFKNGISTSEISTITGMSEKEIKNIIEK